jgi:hypothetical protein
VSVPSFKVNLTTETVLNAAAAGLALLHPRAGIAATAAVPAASDLAKQRFALFRAKREQRLGELLAWSAGYANVELTVLLERCAGNPDAEQLLLRTLHATNETALR